jgi:hypothetical protein
VHEALLNSLPIFSLIPSSSSQYVPYTRRSKNHESPFYAISHLLLLPRLRPKFLAKHLVFEHPLPLYSLNVWVKVSHPYKTKGNIFLQCYMCMYNLKYKELFLSPDSSPRSGRHCELH